MNTTEPDEHLTCEATPQECLCPDIVNPECDRAKTLALNASGRGVVAEAIDHVDAEDTDDAPTVRLEAVLAQMRAAPWLPPERLLAHLALWAVEIDCIHQRLRADWHKADECPEDEDAKEEAAADAQTLAEVVSEYGASWVDVMSLRSRVYTDAAIIGVERAGARVPLEAPRSPVPPTVARKGVTKRAVCEGLF